VTERVMKRLPEKPGVKYYSGQESETDEEGRSLQVVTLYGEDAEQLEETADALEPRFASVPGVLGIKSSGDPAPNELGLVVDRERAQQQGVNPEVLAGVVGYALRGQTLNRYRAEGRDIPVRIRFLKEDRESLAQLSDFYVPGAAGGFVSLASVTDVERLTAPQRIYRRDKRIARNISLELQEGEEDAARARVAALQQQIGLPEGVRFGEPERRGNDEDVQALQFAATLSVVFIYLLMGFLFESFVLPLSIIATIPLAGIGVVWTHYAMGKDVDFLGMVGLVLLIGVVVNNGIVLIDYVNRLRQEGMDRHAALLQAADRRFRPIMMTALTTICGMVPVTLGGATSIGLSYTSFGLTLIGGLTTATLLTLLVVPVFYTFFDDARDAAMATLRRALSPKQAAATVP
jgi:HAE1 family hydrophobic/amphiphilic exporter-1